MNERKNRKMDKPITHIRKSNAISEKNIINDKKERERKEIVRETVESFSSTLPSLDCKK